MDSDDDNVEEVVEGNVVILIHKRLRRRKLRLFVLPIFYTQGVGVFIPIAVYCYYYILLYMSFYFSPSFRRDSFLFFFSLVVLL